MEKFFKQYKEVFDKEGNVRACGREKCMRLILTSDNLEPEISHGDLSSGFMKIEAIKSLYEKLHDRR